MITEPGLYPNIPESQYHTDTGLAPELGRSLSASGAKTLLNEGPERFAYKRDHGSKGSPSMDFGTLVHTLVLRSHDERLVVSPYDAFTTKEARAWKAEMEAAGRIVVKAADVRQAIEVTKAVRAHPIAGPLFAEGRPEVTMYWTDPATHVTMRGRIDWLTKDNIVDLKTAGREGGSLPGPFARQSAQLDYPMSAANYIDGYAALTGVVLPFLTVTVETEAPYWVRVSEYKPADLDKGRDRMAAATAEYAEREAQWDGWSETPTVEVLDVPHWYGRS